jgi:hypothetical protein
VLLIATEQSRKRFLAATIGHETVGLVSTLGRSSGKHGRLTRLAFRPCSWNLALENGPWP